jgi:nickel-dependent lactate racemase
MNVRIDYGMSGLDVALPDERVTVIEPVFRAAVPDPHAVLLGAIRNPSGSAPLRELVKTGQSVAISVCDHTRAQPRIAMLHALFEDMPQVRPEDVTILIATGTHRASTAEELERMLGREILTRYRVVNHDARDPASLVSVGQTSSGVPVLLNRRWLQADFRITTGFVEPHFFAGFSGGPKMVAPGVAGLDTVMVLHDARRIGHPKATFGITEGNPIHDDVREISRMTGVHFSLDVTLNRDKEITGAYAGDISVEHPLACAAAKRDAMQGVNEPFDVVLTSNSGYPLDQNLYQAVKGMTAAAQIVRTGGTIICAAECRDGLPNHGVYKEILSSQPSPQHLVDMINAPGYSRPDQWQVQIQAQIQLKAQVMVKADCLDDEALRGAHIQPVRDVAAAVRNALEAAGPRSTLCVLPQGPLTIPYLTQ